MPIYILDWRDYLFSLIELLVLSRKNEEQLLITGD